MEPLAFYKIYNAISHVRGSGVAMGCAGYAMHKGSGGQRGPWQPKEYFLNRMGQPYEYFFNQRGS